MSSPETELPAIPVIDTGSEFAMETLVADVARAHFLFDLATRGVPRAALKGLDALSRRWLIAGSLPMMAGAIFSACATAPGTTARRSAEMRFAIRCKRRLPGYAAPRSAKTLRSYPK